jgi:hypothetical protein
MLRHSLRWKPALLWKTALPDPVHRQLEARQRDTRRTARSEPQNSEPHLFFGSEPSFEQETIAREIN